MYNLLLILTGGVSCYKSLDLIRSLVKDGHNVEVIMTEHCKKFITPLIVSSLSKSYTYENSDMFALSKQNSNTMKHIDLTRNKDIVIIMPATASFIGKIANGIADDLASTTILANNVKPVFIVPSMNPSMWLNKAVQYNISKLKSYDYQIIEPIFGECVCGEEGIGKMKPIAEIQELIYAYLCDIKKDVALAEENKKNLHNNSESALLSQKNVLITLGSTIEPIDPIRFIGNFSSGKQGMYIIQELISKGANITAIVGKTSQQVKDYLISLKIKIIYADTAHKMYLETEQSLNHIKFDVFIAVAAVADYRVETQSKEKIKKNNHEKLYLTLTKTKDILSMVGHFKLRPKIIIGFAAETENVIQNAQKKLTTKHCDYIIANNVSNNQVFGQDVTNIHIITADQIIELGTLSKQALALRIVRLIFTKE